MGFIKNLFIIKGSTAAYGRDLELLGDGLKSLCDPYLSSDKISKIIQRTTKIWNSLEDSYGERGRNFQRTFIEHCAQTFDWISNCISNPVFIAKDGGKKYRDTEKYYMMYKNLVLFLAALPHDGSHPYIESLWNREKARKLQAKNVY